jgi:hypothetical protein
LDRDHRDTLTGLIELVDDQHPTPRSQNEPQAGPATFQLRAHTRELLQRRERPPDPLTGIRRKREHDDQPVKILNGRSRQRNLRHELQVIERDGLASRRLPQTKLCTFERAINAVEQCDDVRGIRIGIVDGA